MTSTFKNKWLVAGCWLLVTVYYFPSCSSNPDETKKEETTANGKSMTVDTTLHGLTGVIEKNPPVQQGDYVKKYPSGIVQMRGFYLHGKRNGQWTSFFENGKIQSEGFFKDGLRDGKAVVYYQNGQVYYQGYYKDGKEVGKWVFFDENGKQVNEHDYGGDVPAQDKPKS